MAKYRTSKGDTLKSLAKQYGVTRKRLRNLNPDFDFGNKKRGFNKIKKGSLMRLGKGVGTPLWQSEILQDPTYDAFLRSKNYNTGRLNSDFETLKTDLDVKLKRQDNIYANNRIQGMRGIDQSASSRGMYRSGARGRERNRFDERATSTLNTFVNRQSDLRDAGRRKMEAGEGDWTRKDTDAKQAARTRLTDRDAQTKYGY